MLPMGTWFVGTQIAKVKSGESKSKNWGIVKFPHPDGVVAGTTAAQISGPALKTADVSAKIAATPGFPQDEASKEALIPSKAYLEMAVNPNAAKIEVVLNRVHDAMMTDNALIDDGLREMTESVKAIK